MYISDQTTHTSSKPEKTEHTSHTVRSTHLKSKPLLLVNVLFYLQSI